MHLLSEYDAPNPVDDAVSKLRTALAACKEVRDALVAKENEQCQVSIRPAIGATINGLHGSGAGAPDAVDNSYPDMVARLVDAARALGAVPEGYCFCSANRVGDDSKIHEPECADLRAALVACKEARDD